MSNKKYEEVKEILEPDLKRQYEEIDFPNMDWFYNIQIIRNQKRIIELLQYIEENTSGRG